MATVRDLINGSLRLLGVLASGEVASAAEAQDALGSLNGMLYAWSNERLFAMPETEHVVTLAAQQESYTFGPGGDVNIAKPVNIRNMALLLGGSYTSISEVNLDGLTQMSESAYTATQPQAYFPNYQTANVKVYFYPPPAAGTQVRFYSWSEFVSVNDTLALPIGFENAIRYNLAVDLAAEYGVEVPKFVADKATATKGVLVAANAAKLAIPTTRTGPPTIRDLIAGSLRLIGVLTQGQTMDAYQAQGGLRALNNMIDSWSTERLSVMATTQQNVTLATSKTTYTVGPGGDINMPRPNMIYDVSAVYPSGPADVYIALDEITLDQFSSYAYLAFQTPIPQEFYINTGYPLTEISFIGRPLAGTRLRFWTWDTLSQFATINDTPTLAPGYEKAIRYALAMELAPEYGREPSAAVIHGAEEAKANIQRLNVQDIVLGVDPALQVWHGGGWNRLIGGYN